MVRRADVERREELCDPIDDMRVPTGKHRNSDIVGIVILFFDSHVPSCSRKQTHNGGGCRGIVHEVDDKVIPLSPNIPEKRDRRTQVLFVHPASGHCRIVVKDKVVIDTEEGVNASAGVSVMECGEEWSRNQYIADHILTHEQKLTPIEIDVLNRSSGAGEQESKNPDKPPAKPYFNPLYEGITQGVSKRRKADGEVAQFALSMNCSEWSRL